MEKEEVKIKSRGISTKLRVSLKTIPDKKIKRFEWYSYRTPPDPADYEDPFYSPTVLLRWYPQGKEEFGFSYSTGWFNFPQEDDNIVNEWTINDEFFNEEDSREIKTLEWSYFEHLT